MCVNEKNDVKILSPQLSSPNQSYSETRRKECGPDSKVVRYIVNEQLSTTDDCSFLYLKMIN
jgi:hypothetical protein